MLAGVLALALAASAAAADAPVTSADLVTPGDQYPMPKGLHSWATVLADVFVNKVILLCSPLSLQKPEMLQGHLSYTATSTDRQCKLQCSCVCTCCRISMLMTKCLAPVLWRLCLHASAVLNGA